MAAHTVSPIAVEGCAKPPTNETASNAIKGQRTGETVRAIDQVVGIDYGEGNHGREDQRERPHRYDAGAEWIADIRQSKAAAVEHDQDGRDLNGNAHTGR